MARAAEEIDMSDAIRKKAGRVRLYRASPSEGGPTLRGFLRLEDGTSFRISLWERGEGERDGAVLSGAADLEVVVDAENPDDEAEYLRRAAGRVPVEAPRYGR